MHILHEGKGDGRGVSVWMKGEGVLIWKGEGIGRGFRVDEGRGNGKRDPYGWRERARKGIGG